MNILSIIFYIKYFLIILILIFKINNAIEAETKPKNSDLHFVMYNGNKEGLLRQHKMVGEFLECTYIQHLNFDLENGEKNEVFKPGTGIDRSLSKVVTLEEIDKIEYKISSIKCQKKKIEDWINDISKSLESNLFTIMEISSWKDMINSNILNGEVGRILSILENKSSNPIGKVLDATKAFKKYLDEILDSYLTYLSNEKKMNNMKTFEEKRINAEISVITLGKRENSALVNFLKVIRELSKNMREMKSLMERLFPLVSSENCSNRVMKGLELVQLSFFLLNGINILSVIEEQRMNDKFRREMIRRSFIIQSEIERNTFLKYPKFSKAPNFETISEFLIESVKKNVDLTKLNEIKLKFNEDFDLMVQNFGISCPYILTSILRISKINNFFNNELFEKDTIKNCKLAWKEISSYLYREGQVLPSAVIRLAIKKALNKHLNTVISWPRNANELYDKVIVDSKFIFYFDTSNEYLFISTCIDVIQGDIGINTRHKVSLDEIIIICFNFYNSLEVYTESYNYGSYNKSNKDKNLNITTNYVTIKTLPSNIRAKALDISISYTISGIIDFPPFKSNDLDRVVIGILAENFFETCIQRVDSVFGRATRYQIDDPSIICNEAINILKNYNMFIQDPNKNEDFDIFDQYNIINITYLPNNLKLNVNNLSSKEYARILQNQLGNIYSKKQISQDKQEGISPLNKLDSAKTYHLIKAMHFEWMDQMRYDPRYKGLTYLELKNNSPWKKQLDLWHSLITTDLPEVRYAATYKNNRPSRFPILPGDRRGKSKKITPLEDILDKETIEPKYRARYALFENQYLLDQDFDLDHETQSYTNKYQKFKKYERDENYKKYLKNRDNFKDGKYIVKKNIDYLSLKDKRINHDYIKNNYYQVLNDNSMKYENNGIKYQKSNKKLKLLENEFGIRNGCKANEIPTNWGQRAIILYENMNKIFKDIEYEGSNGPGNFISIDDICYILERDFKVKKNYFEDVSKVTLMECYKWFKEYLSKLWLPFNFESLQNNIKSLCWESGFVGWL